MTGDLETTLTRLSKSADRMAELREALELEKQRRDALIVEARDHGASWRTVAARGRLSISGCVGIVNAAA